MSEDWACERRVSWILLLTVYLSLTMLLTNELTNRKHDGPQHLIAEVMKQQHGPRVEHNDYSNEPAVVHGFRSDNHSSHAIPAGRRYAPSKHQPKSQPEHIRGLFGSQV